jgi:hypothetical protein
MLPGIALLPFAAVCAQEDPVMDYYLDGLDSVFQNEYIFIADTSFTVDVQAVFEKTNYRGKISEIDSAVYRLYYAGGQIDSVDIIDSLRNERSVFPEEFIFFPPWYQEYDFYFYPNDTGVGELAIGFRPDSAHPDTMPSGIISLDRGNFRLQSLLIHDPNATEYDRLSEIYEFETRDGYQRLRKYVKHGVKIGFVGSRYSRQFFEFFNYRLE